MKRFSLPSLFLITVLVIPLSGQTLPSNDPVLKNFWSEAMDSSRLETLAHELLDVIGPRLVGTPSMKKAHDWAVSTYQRWGINAQNERWGQWRGWERGITHIDLIEPRVRTLEGTMLAWSPGTKKGGLTAGLVILPDLADSAAYVKWYPSVKGKFVLTSQPQPTGRPDSNWQEFGLTASFDSLKAHRQRIGDNWNTRIRKTGYRQDSLARVLENAGAVGVLTSRWSSGWGVNKIFGAVTSTVPVLDISLEDYNLLYRLADNGKNPVIRVTAEAKFLGAVPTFNTIATLPGTVKADEYVILSAHFDSWDGSSGATDNGTGSILMMETMRLLKKYYPNPKRTILVGHWGSEEQGLNGSRAFVQDHPEIVNKLQAAFNQDNGTGRIVSISAQGFIRAGEFLARWLSRIPAEVTTHINLEVPGMPSGGGSDNASFIAAGAPGFGLRALSWDYNIYTWHTNRDTYDKLVFDDLKNNAVLIACLAYLASEDPQFLPRDKRELPTAGSEPRTGRGRRGQVTSWPTPRDPERAGGLPPRK